MTKFEFIATATFGLEAVLAEEVKKLGYPDAKTENGRVTFNAGPEAICRANLWLRTADRVRLKVGQFKATTFDELFEKTRALPWPELIPGNAAFPVDGKSVKSGLFSVSDCQAIVKKAVVESMKRKYKKEWFEEKGPLYRLEVALLKDIATLTIDTSGAGLHKRGYREGTGEAPLRETLAAALVLLSRWYPDTVLWDPYCGSGTIPIEAALIGRNIAPGMNRTFASESWPTLPRETWRQARRETHDMAEFDRPSTGPRERPTYTVATLIPSTPPLSSGGNTEVRMAMPVPKIMALPTPCSTRKAISDSMDQASPQKREARPSGLVLYCRAYMVVMAAVGMAASTIITLHAPNMEVGISRNNHRGEVINPLVT